MVPPERAFDPAAIEEEARGVWRSRQLPPAGGAIGAREGPLVLQFEGTFTPGEPEVLVAYRAVAADVEARSLALAGRRAVGTLRLEEPARAGPPPVSDLFNRLAIWIGGDGATAWDSASRHARVEAMVGRLARRGILVSRDLPLRACPVCASACSPERLIYQEEEGDAYIVQFDFALDGRTVHALVWVDAPWRLLGTSALLVHPDLPYVLARCRRGETDELVLTSRSSLERFRDWMPRTTFEVLEEHPGRFFEGKPYDYPLRHEFPSGGALNPPGGTILAVPDVTDTGTGLVILVPGHGSTDAEIADQRGVTGWPLITPRGQLDLTLMHKYSGLDLATGSEFILRDLAEGGAIFAQLRVRRGVPHCAICGSALLWVPGRAWCLEPSRFPPARRADYSRLLPGAPPLDRLEVAPWPVSENSRPDDPDAIALLECSRCERLDALSGPVACPCGGRRYPVRRRLLPSAAGALSAWARFDPFPLAAAVRLYVGERRRVPAVVHQLMASAGLEGELGEIGITRLPTIPEVPVRELLATHGADAVRSAFVRMTSVDRSTGSFADRCRIERDRLARIWEVVGEVLMGVDAGTLSTFTQSIEGFLGELETEDRALLARWERTRVLALADYDRFDPASVHRRIVRFLDTDLAAYRQWVRPRLGLTGAPPPKRAALRTLFHVLRSLATLLGPIAPETAEAIWRRLTTGRTSLFEGSFLGVDRSILNDELWAAWDRWGTVLRAVGEFRRACRVTPEVTIPVLALVVGDDALGDKLRSDRPVLERLCRVARIDIGSPREPWTGRHGKYRPVESEIQRLYPSQATLISHLLARTPPRNLKGAGAPGELSLVIQGQTLRILPTMVEYAEILPPGIFPQPWSLGEMYLAVPEGGTPPARVPPPLSRDAYWLVRHVERRLRRAHFPATSPAGVAIIDAADPLLSELKGQAEAIARFLGLAEVRVAEQAAERPARRLNGRTRTGTAWWVEVPGIGPQPARSKHRAKPPRCRRVPVGPSIAPPPEVDLGSDEAADTAQAIRALGGELDELLGVPVLGPTKIAKAWERGLTSVEAFRTAEFDQLVALPGFGDAIASRLVVKFGRTPPSRHARPLSRPSTPITEIPVGRPPSSAAGPPLIPSPESELLPPVAETSVLTVTPGPSPRDAAAAERLVEPERALEVATEESTPPLEGTPVPTPSPPTSVEIAPELAVVPEAPPAPAEIPPESVPSESSEEPKPTAPAAAAPEPLGPEPPAATLEVTLPIGETTEIAEVEEPEMPPEAEISESAPPPVEPIAESPPLAPPEEPAPGIPSTAETPTETPPSTEAETAPDGSSGEVPPESIPPLESPASAQVEAAEEAPPTEPVVLPEEVEPSALTESRPGAEEVAPPPSQEVVPIRPETSEIPPLEAGVSQPESPSVEEKPTTTPEPVELPVTVGTPGVAPPEIEPSAHESRETPEPVPAVGEPVPEETKAETPVVASAGPPIEPETLGEPVAPVPATPAEATSPSEAPASPGERAPLAETQPEPAPPTPSMGPSVPLTSAPPPPPERPVPPTGFPVGAPPPAPSGIELEVGSSPFTSLQPFLDATAAGHRGLCLVRESPARIAAQVGPRPVDVYWLTNLGRGKTLRPSDVSGIFAMLGRAVRDEHVTALFLEGIEYLVRIHGVDELVDRLTELDGLAKTHDARVWVHLTPDLLRPHDLERITMALRPPEGQ